MMRPFRLNRRQFLKTSAGLALIAGPAAATHWATREPIRLGLIGAGGRGRQLAKKIQSDVLHRVQGNIVAVCDVDRSQAEAMKRDILPATDLYEDYRRVLERDDIAGVLVVTPDHWHTAITAAALRAGKAVYCEKPLTLTVAEGHLLIQTVRETGGVLQVGTQQRSSWQFQRACELVRNGRLGTLQRVTISVPTYQKGGPFLAQPVPPGLNWDLWLGQAPWAEYCPERCHRRYRNWYEYGGGSMTDWGTHHLDIAHWAMGLDQTGGPLTIEGHAELPRIANGYNTPSDFSVDMLYPNDVRVLVQTSPTESGILFEGDRGRIFVNRKRLTGKPVDDLARQPLPRDAVRIGKLGKKWDSYEMRHLLDFYHCLKTGETPISDVISQHRTASACHLANISLRLGRKLHWDAERERFLDDDDANAMLSRPQRAPYSLLA
jgi:predicted dehydrogenase